MRLGDYFQPSGKKAGAQRETGISSDISRSYQLNRQIRALVPGQTLQGEIVSRNGSEVQVRLADDMMLTAKLEQAMNLELGRSMSFTVLNNGSALTLSPLFANMATDANVLKALDMAALPANQITVSMTQSLMEAGLPIDKGTLSQVLRELTAHPEARLEDVIDLHRLGMKVTGDNIQQIASYKELTHQLVSGMTNLCDELPAVMQQMAAGGEEQAAVRLFLAIAGQLCEDGASGPAGNSALTGGFLQAGTEGVLTELPEGTGQNVVTGSGRLDFASGILQDIPLGGSQEGNRGIQESLSQMGNGKTGDGIIGIPWGAGAFQEGMEAETAGANTVSGGNGTAEAALPGEILTRELLDILDQAKLPRHMDQYFRDSCGQLSGTNSNSQQALRLLAQLAEELLQHSPGSSKDLSHALSGRAVKEFFTRAVLDSWTIRPEDVSDLDKLDTLFNRMNRQLNRMGQALEQAGQLGSNAGQSVNRMAGNLDFLNQMNQLYAYVQLPLKMGKNPAHGELYVYSNKKHLSSRDGNVSALLHLDMAHLGPVDIYVAMEGSRVNTHFFVQNEGMIDFLSEHMDLLTRRLQEKGYHLSCEMQVKERTGGGESVIHSILGENAPNSPLVQYAFDVRA